MVAGIVLILAAAYLGLGLIFALVFVLFGVHRIDPAARGSGAVFRAMIVPGCTLLWPFMARRWFRLAQESPS